MNKCDHTKFVSNRQPSKMSVQLSDIYKFMLGYSWIVTPATYAMECGCVRIRINMHGAGKTERLLINNKVYNKHE